MAKALSQNFHQTEAILNPLNRTPDISDDIQQTLARLMGFNEVDKLWRFLRSDESGRLLVSTGQVSSPSILVSTITVQITSTLLLSANKNRVRFELNNLTQNRLSIGFSFGFLPAQAILLLPGQVFYDEDYKGDVFARCTVATVGLAVYSWE